MHQISRASFNRVGHILQAAPWHKDRASGRYQTPGTSSSGFMRCLSRGWVRPISHNGLGIWGDSAMNSCDLASAKRDARCDDNACPQ